MDINLIGTFNYLCYGARAISKAPANEDGERGVIINTSSNAYSQGQIGQAAYSASKGAVLSMTLPIARELALHGIRVNTIVPGVVDTNMSGVGSLGKASNQPRRERAAGEEDPVARNFIFPKRRGHASEFASLALELISNSLLNGSAYPLDGALRMGPRW